MIPYKTLEEIELVRESAQLVSKTLGELKNYIVPGALPIDLDKIAETFIKDHKAIPGFLGLYDFPNSLCDCGVLKNNYYGDNAYTYEVGKVSNEIKKLLKVTKESLYRGIKKLKVGNKIGDVSHEIQSYTESFGYGVVRELVGHGLGKNMHEDPEIPNYGLKNTGPKIQNGLVVAIEPMINLGTKDILQLNDGWTVITKDKKPSAHFEHNVAVINGEPNILSTFDYIESIN